MALSPESSTETLATLDSWRQFQGDTQHTWRERTCSFDNTFVAHSCVDSPATIEHNEISGFIRALMRFYADARGLDKGMIPSSVLISHPLTAPVMPET